MAVALVSKDSSVRSFGLTVSIPILLAPIQKIRVLVRKIGGLEPPKPLRVTAPASVDHQGGDVSHRGDCSGGMAFEWSTTSWAGLMNPINLSSS